jgi:hypothetical protein
MHIDWLGLGKVFVVSLGAALSVMVLFALGVVALSGTGRVRRIMAFGSFALCGVVTLLGITVILA